MLWLRRELLSALKVLLVPSKEDFYVCLASNLLGGFKESFSFAFRFCRFVTLVWLQRLPINKSFYLLILLKEMIWTMKKTVMKQCTERTFFQDIWNSSKLMKIFPCLMVVYAMHDFLEGVAQNEIKLLLRHCIDNKYLTLTDYNHRLVFFNYGHK